MTAEFYQKFDGIINILTGVAFLYYAAFTHVVQKSRGYRVRLLFLLTLVGGLCLIRGSNYLLHIGVFVEILVLMISSVIPLSIVLLVELMMRRHLPRALKIFTAGASMALMFGFLFLGVQKAVLLALVFYYLIILLWFFKILLFKKNLELEEVELNLIRLTGVISLLIIPLLGTDFKIVLGLETTRLGAFGMLFFLYSLVKVWDIHDLRLAVIRLILLLTIHIISTGAICFAFGIWDNFFHLLILLLMLKMFVEVIEHTQNRTSLMASEISSKLLDHFVKGGLIIDQIKNGIMASETFIMITKEELYRYDCHQIEAAFGEGGLFYKGDIKEMKLDVDTKDEVGHLFEDHDSDACYFLKLSDGDFFLVLLKWPSLAPKARIVEESMLIRKLALNIRK